LTTGFVADSSVGVAWAVASQSSEVTRGLLDEVYSDRRWVIPVLWMFEVANSLLVLVRRQRISPEEYARARHDLAQLRPLVDEEGPRLALSEISELAGKHALSVYDAVYLELALRRGLPLASRDEALNKAARRASVKTLLD
jgi:predicted nucleic acid-binding protein